jgi:hypothetical protein
MVTIENSTLVFTFPEVHTSLRAALENKIKSIKPQFQLPADRSTLYPRLGPRSRFTSSQFSLYEASEDNPEWFLNLTQSRIDNELRDRVLRFLPSVPPSLRISFQRTLRVPDDGNDYPLPAGLGKFPLRNIDNYAERLDSVSTKRGGVMLPMYQSEALWLNFDSEYPFALKIGAGKTSAITSKQWQKGLTTAPQDYLAVPDQPWIDGFCVQPGVVKQFVAAQLGSGCTIEEQIAGTADVGGIQLECFPMHAARWVEGEMEKLSFETLEDLLVELYEEDHPKPAPVVADAQRCFSMACPASPMGLGAGGRIKQEIYADEYGIEAWESSRPQRCFVHIFNSMRWREVTSENPPHPPMTQREYKRTGIPWFDYYRDDLKPLPGSDKLAEAKSVQTVLGTLGGLPPDESMEPQLIVQYGNARRPEVVREFDEEISNN